MTVIQQITAAHEYAELWRALMPSSELPGMDQFLLWTGRYSGDLVSRGINRAAGKVRKLSDTDKPMTSEDAARYASSVMRNELLGIRQQRGIAWKR